MVAVDTESRALAARRRGPPRARHRLAAGIAAARGPALQEDRLHAAGPGGGRARRAAGHRRLGRRARLPRLPRPGPRGPRRSAPRRRRARSRDRDRARPPLSGRHLRRGGHSAPAVATRTIHRLPLAAVRAGAEAVRDALGRAAGGHGRRRRGDRRGSRRARRRHRAAPGLAARGLGWARAGGGGRAPLSPRHRSASARAARGSGSWAACTRRAAPSSPRSRRRARRACISTAARMTAAARRIISAVSRALEHAAAPPFSPAPPAARLAPRDASRALGAATARVLAYAAPDVLAVTGGETAYDVLQALGATRLDLLGAPASGLALGALTFAGSPRPDHEPAAAPRQGGRLRRAGSLPDPSERDGPHDHAPPPAGHHHGRSRRRGARDHREGAGPAGGGLHLPPRRHRLGRRDGGHARAAPLAADAPPREVARGVPLRRGHAGVPRSRERGRAQPAALAR